MTAKQTTENHLWHKFRPAPSCSTVKMRMDPPLYIANTSLLCLVRDGQCEGRFEASMSNQTDLCLTWIPPTRSRREKFLQWIGWLERDTQPAISNNDMLINMGEFHEEGKSVPESYNEIGN